MGVCRSFVGRFLYISFPAPSLHFFGFCFVQAGGHPEAPLREPDDDELNAMLEPDDDELNAMPDWPDVFNFDE